MSTLLEKALEKVVALPQNEQDAIASEILASLADEEAWKKRFAEKRHVIRRILPGRVWMAPRHLDYMRQRGKGLSIGVSPAASGVRATPITIPSSE